MRIAPDLMGKAFGKLVVVSKVKMPDNKTRWLCKCECGKEKIIRTASLLMGDTKSCGCLRDYVTKHKNLSHGLSGTKEYIIWGGIVARCYDEKNQAYPSYGGRGILMSDEWRNSFQAFFNDMGKRPSIKHSIERIENDKGYFNGNCKWATKKEQARNRRTSKIVEINGQLKTVAEWCEIYNIKTQSVYSRIMRGASYAEAITKSLLRHPKPKVYLKFNGETKSISEWAREKKVTMNLIQKRIQSGWDAEKILSTPKLKRW